MDTVIALAPLIVLQLVLMGGALFDLARRVHVTGGKKLPRFLLVIFVGTIGPIIYFVFGRKDEQIERD